MKHSYKIDGFTYRLRPVTIDDAQTVLDIRLEDAERNRYVHSVKNDVELEKQWIQNYYERQGDFFFAVENKFTDETEGLIAIYNEKDGHAEWGRWTIRKNSLAATESVYLLYEAAFETIGLKELYCRTIVDNVSVVEFHKSAGLKFREIRKGLFELNGKEYDAVEQYLTADDFENEIKDFLFEKSFALFKRNLKIYSGGIEFHHIGIACTAIEKDKRSFQMLGYSFESKCFEDDLQGVRGVFGTAKNQPRIELLENLKDSNTLSPWLDKGVKMYHFGYLVNDIGRANLYLKKIGSKLISPLKDSVYFDGKICFYMLKNMMLIELMENLNDRKRKG